MFCGFVFFWFGLVGFVCLWFCDDIEASPKNESSISLGTIWTNHWKFAPLKAPRDWEQIAKVEQKQKYLERSRKHEFHCSWFPNLCCAGRFVDIVKETGLSRDLEERNGSPLGTGWYFFPISWCYSAGTRELRFKNILAFDCCICITLSNNILTEYRDILDSDWNPSFSSPSVVVI